jgi:uncharacterized membrane protein
MEYYQAIKTLHIIFAGMWLVNLFLESALKGFVINNENKIGEKKFIHLYLFFGNLLGVLGATGILITGISLVCFNYDYHFFQLTGNHWLTAKQVLTVVVLILTGTMIVPTAKKIRLAIGRDLESYQPIDESGYKSLRKLFRLNTIVNIIIFINFLLAITHKLIN